MNSSSCTKVALTVIAVILAMTGCKSTVKPESTASPQPTAAQPAAADANQVADMSEYVSAKGITIPRDGQEAPAGIGAFFVTKDGMEMPISLRGNPTLATLNYSGTMECTSDGRLAGGTDKFKPTTIETSKRPGKRLKISSFSIGKDGLLVVSDVSGASYKVRLPPLMSQASGTIEELPKE